MGVNILYRYEGNKGGVSLPNSIEIHCFSPSFKHPMLSLHDSTGFAKNYHNCWVELRWAIVSLMRYKIYYITVGGKIVHTSYCSPKCFKFPFMKKTDWHIGPCHTDSLFRGGDIYPTMLRIIANDLKRDNNNLFMIVEDTNIASTRGVLKAGFVCAGTLNKSKILKRYTLK